MKPTDKDRKDACDYKIDMPDYLRCSTKRVADRRASAGLTNKIHNCFNDVFFQAYAALKEHSHCRSRKVVSYMRHPEEGKHMLYRNP